MFFSRIMMALSPLVVLAQFCIVIWGSVLVFGKFINHFMLSNFFQLYLIALLNKNRILYDINSLKIGWYGYWTYDTTDKANEGYCGYTPFMYSFVMLILGWVTIPFLLCCLCSFFIAFIMAR